jgi:hypothetical protein
MKSNQPFHQISVKTYISHDFNESVEEYLHNLGEGGFLWNVA